MDATVPPWPELYDEAGGERERELERVAGSQDQFSSSPAGELDTQANLHLFPKTAKAPSGLLFF